MKRAIGTTILLENPKEIGVFISSGDLSGAPEFREMVVEIAPTEEQQFVELMFVVHFAIRQLSNLGVGEDSRSLADRLRRLAYDENASLSALRDPLGITAKVTSSPGENGKRIDAELLVDDQGSKLSIKTSGFGFMNRKLWPCIPPAVVALFLAIAARRSNERAFVRRLLVAAAEIERRWSLGHVTLSNHAQFSRNIAIAAWQIRVEGEYNKEHSSKLKSSSLREQVGLSKPESELGAELADRLNRRLEESQSKLHRLVQVSNEFWTYTREAQKELAEAAIFWGYAALANHELRGESEAYVAALVDVLYVYTDEAMKEFSESERERICIAASAVKEHLASINIGVVRESRRKVGSLENRNPARSTAEMLNSVHSAYLNHASPFDLRDLIGHIAVLCYTIDANETGVGSQTEVVGRMKEVADCAHKISNTVLCAVKSGKLVVKDGMIIDPTEDNEQVDE